MVTETIFEMIVMRVYGHTSSDDARADWVGVVAMRWHGERETGERRRSGLPKSVGRNRAEKHFC